MLLYRALFCEIMFFFKGEFIPILWKIRGPMAGYQYIGKAQKTGATKEDRAD